MEAKDIKKVAVIGCGVIGASWALLFAMKGKEVHLFDVVEDVMHAAKDKMNSNIDTLVENGALEEADRQAILDRVTTYPTLEEAVTDVQFIQENGPERLPIKQSVLAQIEAACPTDAIYASSTSGLLISDIVANAVHPERCVGGHPYNPPHLIPLVEMTYSPKTSKENLQLAKDFYQSIGKEAVVLNKECPGFIANRLQLAVYREMIDLVMRGVCTAEDADKALVYGPGIRWAIFGHNMIMQLGNPGGLKGMMEMLGDGGDKWLADMADWKHMPNKEYGEIAQASVDEMMKNFPDYIGHDNAHCSKYRDEMLIDILKLHHKL
ncbi:MAG: 3-hydroxyacyl-CoA dehydrogenase NAD-binding domain-containing protein [Lachnospiraceae bacterium]|jgi:3-hydroxyacyl-CoA dehydrogenase|nr:3-hydroxyacyl-CoA dehydrogenase NAD-binding domain-containing protein [Lachnospiraceae bacterium]MCI1658048.1 3-hydroxyacyl-CoA dehydrogenase NAD-binding domain-containing protein [Lachnospiraceae bacterium]MCI2196188.1 3-hydroxyacyl-CoA dehydrogenase NAD-binding domain-containing protein [Lachnospiraceae bacterium]